jgi:hypothetical protein
MDRGLIISIVILCVVGLGLALVPVFKAANPDPEKDEDKKR